MWAQFSVEVTSAWGREGAARAQSRGDVICFSQWEGERQQKLSRQVKVKGCRGEARCISGEGGGEGSRHRAQYVQRHRGMNDPGTAEVGEAGDDYWSASGKRLNCHTHTHTHTPSQLGCSLRPISPRWAGGDISTAPTPAPSSWLRKTPYSPWWGASSCGS